MYTMKDFFLTGKIVSVKRLNVSIEKKKEKYGYRLNPQRRPINDRTFNEKFNFKFYVILCKIY